MGIDFFSIKDQANGNFNNGEILEKKPIGFPQDGGKLKPYSNLFYWAHAWTTNRKSTIGLHPHQGFGICSFVLKGKINHYDTKQNKWITLSEGDVQIIRSRNGISHSEEIGHKSEIFQIWFDPDISRSLKKEASTNDAACPLEWLEMRLCYSAPYWAVLASIWGVFGVDVRRFSSVLAGGCAFLGLVFGQVAKNS